MTSAAYYKLERAIEGNAIQTQGSTVANLVTDYEGLVRSEPQFAQQLANRLSVKEHEWRWSATYVVVPEGETSLSFRFAVTDDYPDRRKRFQSHTVVPLSAVTSISVEKWLLSSRYESDYYVGRKQWLHKVTIQLAMTVRCEVVAEPVFLVSAAQSLPLRAVSILFHEQGAAVAAAEALQILAGECGTMGSEERRQVSWNDLL